jgi:hypothetical protein
MEWRVVKVPDLTAAVDQLHETASNLTGLYGFGPQGYLEGLRKLLEAYETDLQLTDAGRTAICARTGTLLQARLYAQDGWLKCNDVSLPEISAPLVIIGLPRTGTTALSWLLAMDDQWQGIEYWLTRTPMMRPPRDTWDSTVEFRACADFLNELFRNLPGARRFHTDVTACKHTECQLILMQSFVCNVWNHLNLPTYTAWYQSQDATQSYQRYVDVLRLIGAGESGRRWLLRSPCHMGEIGALLEVFPDARIIQTHRDPVESIPSLCDMLYVGAQELEGESARASIIGPRECTYWRRALDHVAAVRQRRSANFFDVDHREFLSRPLETVRAIYEHFGLTLQERITQRMSKWIGDNSKPKRTLTPDRWGVSHADICEAFSGYRALHGFA